jgi:hypothetical protein
MRREQDAYRSQFLDLPVERGYSFFEHAPVGGVDSTVQVLLCSSSRQFQGAPLLFPVSGLGCHIRFERGRPALRFFLLGFNKLRVESSGHGFIVIMSGSVIRDPGSGRSREGAERSDPGDRIPEPGARIPDPGSRNL